MYNSIFIAERIKNMSKLKNILIKNMLEDCGLSKNTLSSMLSGGSTPKSENLAKIADYLDCSVDYLLGRTDIPEVNRGTAEIINIAPAVDFFQSTSPQSGLSLGKSSHTTQDEIKDFCASAKEEFTGELAAFGGDFASKPKKKKPQLT